MGHGCSPDHHPLEHRRAVTPQWQHNALIMRKDHTPLDRDGIQGLRTVQMDSSILARTTLGGKYAYFPADFTARLHHIPWIWIIFHWTKDCSEAYLTRPGRTMVSHCCSQVFDQRTRPQSVREIMPEQASLSSSFHMAGAGGHHRAFSFGLSSSFSRRVCGVDASFGRS